MKDILKELTIDSVTAIGGYFDFTSPQFLGQLGILLIGVTFAALMSQLIYYTYLKCGNTFSNRKNVSSYFLIITVCTTIIITIIQSSLTLSLGLVGALSIIRFRTAVKEQEELSYVFLCISVGIGYGAKMQLLTTSVCVFIILIIFLRTKILKNNNTITYNLTIISEELEISEVGKILAKYARQPLLKRVDEENGRHTIYYHTNFEDEKGLVSTINELKSKDRKIYVSFVSNAIV